MAARQPLWGMDQVSVRWRGDEGRVLKNETVMMPTALAVLPNAGLANKLFVWAAAEVFGAVNGCATHTLGWTYPKIGPWLRGDRSMRMYARYFERSSLRAVLALCTRGLGRRMYVEPGCQRVQDLDGSGLYVFKNVPHWRDMFGEIRAHRTLIQSRLFGLIRPHYRRQLFDHVAPVVALHIRRGDFRPLKANEDFARVGNVQTPNDYFLSIIAGIRSAAGRAVPITVFSDGSDAELAFVLTLPGVTRSQTTNDVVDLLLMSRARVIVPSAGSTFSEWAGFLSDAAIVRHPDHIHAPIRSPDLSSGAFEQPTPASQAEWNSWWQRAQSLIEANDAAAPHFLSGDVRSATGADAVREVVH